ncbi:ChaN family lipoprotein [Arenibacter amylolyticus]|uniref:ChaN family lipoprotein n=1 Tax=Arenibacter amylolyticus TaxID=1406873 RepID=UPI000A38EA3C|nr:ChaN family lipoprotein [Arenibacter amylolyticus]
MPRIILVLFFLLLCSPATGQLKSYNLYNSNGKKVSYSKMMRKLAKADIVLFGELHNNPIAHWLQLKVTQKLHTQRPLILGAEMFEADNQIPLNQYLKGEITQKGLDSLARLWPNYKTDYAPLVDFAKANQLPFIATNIPRRFASMVYRNGFSVLDSLTAEEKTWIAPLPIPFDSELPTYKNILSMMGDHGSPKLVMAQAIKDATMAYFILNNYKKENLFLHFNGAYHSDFHEGILWYLKQNTPPLNYLTISTVSQENIHKLLPENRNKADFIICVDSDMTTTY